MDIQRLKYFYTVARLEHVTRAAEELHVSQPSLTQAMHLLEDELDVPLFKKQGRRIALTEFGARLKERLDFLLPQFEDLQKEMQSLKKTVNKTVRLNILAASSFVINAIMRYKKGNEEAIFDFEQSDVKADCDIVIATNGVELIKDRKYSKRCVKEEEIYLAVPRQSRYAGYSSIELSEVKDENFIMLSSLRLFGVICNKFCQIAGFSPKILFESDSPMAVQNIISMGAGVAFWPEYSWGKIKDKNVVLVPISAPVCKRDLIIELYDRSPRSTYSEDFYNYFVKLIENSRR